MLKFTKLQAAGNDFILVDARETERDWITLAREMCHRHLGVGADGLILVLPSRSADLKMRIINSDGSEAEICGNGLRCFAKYAVDRHIVTGPDLTVETLAGVRSVQTYLSGGEVLRATVNMGTPEFGAERIPVTIKKRQGRGKLDIISILDYPLCISGRELSLSFVSMGNPHAVDFISQPVSDFPLSRIGPEVEHHPVFPERINFEVARLLDRRRIEARVWERGAGETLACGSGACAIAVIARLKRYTDEEVDISLPGGKLTIRWDGRGEVYLTGAVEEVFSGEWPR